jgi:hypothetical protein
MKTETEAIQEEIDLALLPLVDAILAVPLHLSETCPLTRSASSCPSSSDKLESFFLKKCYLYFFY